MDQLQAAVEVQGLESKRSVQILHKTVSDPFISEGQRRSFGLYQEAGGVVEEAAETTAEVSLQGGRVFWRDVLRVVDRHVSADLCGVLLICTN